MTARTVTLVRRSHNVERRVFLAEDDRPVKESVKARNRDVCDENVMKKEDQKTQEKKRNLTPLLSRGGSKVPFSRGVFVKESVNENRANVTVSPSHIVESVEQAALGMSKADRQALFDRLSLSLQESEATRDSGMWAQAVVRALQTVLGAGGASAYGPAVAKGVVGAVKAFAPIAEFIKTVGLDEFHIVERQAALNFLAEMVVADADDFARHAGIPLGVKLVSQRQANVRGIFDRAFPSYLSAGLGKIVFRQMASRSEWDGDRSCAS